MSNLLTKLPTLRQLNERIEYLRTKVADLNASIINKDAIIRRLQRRLESAKLGEFYAIVDTNGALRLNRCGDAQLCMQPRAGDIPHDGREIRVQVRAMWGNDE